MKVRFQICEAQGEVEWTVHMVTDREGSTVPCFNRHEHYNLPEWMVEVPPHIAERITSPDCKEPGVIPLPSKGMYVRLIENDDEGEDCGVAKLCRKCFEQSHFSSDDKYWYSPWEDDLEGDTGTCRECGCQVC